MAALFRRRLQHALALDGGGLKVRTHGPEVEAEPEPEEEDERRQRHAAQESGRPRRLAASTEQHAAAAWRRSPVKLGSPDADVFYECEPLAVSPPLDGPSLGALALGSAPSRGPWSSLGEPLAVSPPLDGPSLGALALGSAPSRGPHYSGLSLLTSLGSLGSLPGASPTLPLGSPPASPPHLSQQLELDVTAATIAMQLRSLPRVDGVVQLSALASPRGVRRRLKSFFAAHCPSGLGKTDVLVAEIAHGLSTEEQVFARLLEQHSVAPEAASALLQPRSQVRPRAVTRLWASDELDSDQEQESKDAEGYESDVIEAIIRGFGGERSAPAPGRDNAHVHEHEHELAHATEQAHESGHERGATSRSMISFSETVLEIHTEISGLPLGSELVPLKEEPCSPVKASGMLRGSARKPAKRRVRRLTAGDKALLILWRRDLESAKAAAQQAQPEAQQDKSDDTPLRRRGSRVSLDSDTPPQEAAMVAPADDGPPQHGKAPAPAPDPAPAPAGPPPVPPTSTSTSASASASTSTSASASASASTSTSPTATPPGTTSRPLEPAQAREPEPQNGVQAGAGRGLSLDATRHQLTSEQQHEEEKQKEDWEMVEGQITLAPLKKTARGGPGSSGSSLSPPASPGASPGSPLSPKRPSGSDKARVRPPFGALRAVALGGSRPLLPKLDSGTLLQQSPP
jgi:hypothetical protein